MKTSGYQPLPDDRPVRWGVLATGGIAATVTDDMLTLPEECQVVACASRNLDKAQQFAAERGIAQAFGSYAELAACPEVDVVYIATPHSHHLEPARMCLEAGKHVLVEKALTPSPEATDELVAIARESGLFLMEAVWMRCNPLIRQAARLVQDGTLGVVSRARANFDISWSGDDSNRMVNPDLAGGGILDLGIYPIHALNLLFGEPSELVSAGRLYHTGVDCHAEALLTWAAREDDAAFTRPVVAHASCTLDGESPMVLEVVGDKGRLEVPGFLRPTEMTFTPRDGEPQQFRCEVPGNGYTFELQEVVSCLRGGATESTLVPWESTRQVARTLETWRSQLGVRPAPAHEVE